jgi:hypothetical protein
VSCAQPNRPTPALNSAALAVNHSADALTPTPPAPYQANDGQDLFSNSGIATHWACCNNGTLHTKNERAAEFQVCAQRRNRKLFVEMPFRRCALEGKSQLETEERWDLANDSGLSALGAELSALFQVDGKVKENAGIGVIG